MKVAGEGPFVVPVVPWGGTHMDPGGGTVAREGERVGGHRNHHGLGEAACRASVSTLEMAGKGVHSILLIIKISNILIRLHVKIAHTCANSPTPLRSLATLQC